MRGHCLNRKHSRRNSETHISGRARAPGPRSRAAGFSLLEVTIAIGLLGVAVLGVAAAQLGSLKVTRESYLRAQAMFLAEQQLELFQAMSAANLLLVPGPNDPANPIDPNPGDGDTTTFNRGWTIAADTPETDVITISVLVRWVDSRGVPRILTLRTMKAS
jgi:Tfp pilus assembly protein PilV